MAMNGDQNFKRSLDSTSLREQSAAETAFVKNLAAAPPPEYHRATLDFFEDKDKEEENFSFRERKRGLLNIDLNALPEDDSPPPLAAVASSSGEDKVSLESECRSDLNVIAEDVVVVVVDDVNGSNRADLSVRNCEKRTNETASSHCPQPKLSTKIDVLEEEKRNNEIAVVNSHKRWKALLDVSEIALREYESESRTRNLSRNRRASREAELGGALLKRSTKRSNNIVCSGGDVEEVVAPPPVVRSTRGRTVALPNKYKDSFLGPVVAAEFPRRNRTGKSADRKFR